MSSGRVAGSPGLRKAWLFVFHSSEFGGSFDGGACGFFQDDGCERIEVCGGDAVRCVGVDGVFGGEGGDLFAGAEVEAEVEAGVEGGVGAGVFGFVCRLRLQFFGLKSVCGIGVVRGFMDVSE